MFRIRKILVPTDFSSFSLGILETAVEFARTFRAGLIVLHVVEDLPLTQHPTVSVASVEEILDEMENRARARLTRTIGPRIRGRVPSTLLVTRGTPFLEILRVAKERKAGLILLATHGRTGLSHLVMGSTAEKVVRRSPCPVLTIRPGARARRRS